MASMTSLKRGKTFIVSGEIGEDVTARDVLAMVLRNKSVEFGNLHITSESGIEGDIAICRGTYVLAARAVDCDHSDWEMLKLLLATQAGSYRYVDLTDQFPQRVKSHFKVRLTDLITLWPRLPAKPEQMKCGRTSFNRILAYSTEREMEAEPFYVEWTKASIRLCLKHE